MSSYAYLMGRSEMERRGQSKKIPFCYNEVRLDFDKLRLVFFFRLAFSSCKKRRTSNAFTWQFVNTFILLFSFTFPSHAHNHTFSLSPYCAEIMLSSPSFHSFPMDSGQCTEPTRLSAFPLPCTFIFNDFPIETLLHSLLLQLFSWELAYILDFLLCYTWHTHSVLVRGVARRSGPIIIWNMSYNFHSSSGQAAGVVLVFSMCIWEEISRHFYKCK